MNRRRFPRQRRKGLGRVATVCLVSAISLVLLGLLWDRGGAAQAVNPSWSATGSLTAARIEHTATLLPNGKVLVAAGFNGSSYLSSAELYDPATGSWSVTSSLNTARRLHTATLLPNGKVLVVGGHNGSGYLNSAELYDPATGTWTATDSLNTARSQHTASLLPNGKVLVVGGSGNSGYLSSAELYDPATGSWTATNSLTTARGSHTASLLPDGKVLVAAGFGNSSSRLNSAELYDPATGSWSATNSLTTARGYHTATLLPNSKVLVVGGIDNSYLSSAELYDPASGNWTATNSLNTARSQHTATLLPSGKVLVVGADSTSGSLSSVELYDPATGNWTATNSLNTARSQHTATLLPGGKVLVVGGDNDNSGSLNSAESYDPATGSWSPTASLNMNRSGHTATLLPNGKVLVAGGVDSTLNARSNADLYDPATGNWTATNSLSAARYSHTATLLPNGKVLVVGGVRGGSYLNSAELYDPATGSWSVTSSLNMNRFGHTATLLPNGKVLVVGGYNGSSYLTSAELYDPASGTWTATDSLTAARVSHTATLLPDGKVLVAGGYNGSSHLSSAELYDPASGTWTAIDSLTAARGSHTATLLPDGKVLVAGGIGNSSYLNSAELYDPATGSWSATASLNMNRFGHTATLLPNGKVLVVGGFGGNGYLSSAELYDPANGSWSVTSSLNTARRQHTATLLPDGKVLVVGGFNGSGPLSSVVLYDTGLGFSSSAQPIINSATSRLDLNTQLVLSGARFRGISGASGDNFQSSPSDYPLVQLRSLDNDQTRFLLADPAQGWSDTAFTSLALTDFPIGHALVTVFTNGIPSAAKLILVADPALRTASSFSNLSAPTITYGTATTTLSGQISGSPSNPTGHVAITLNGVTQQAAIQADGTFSANFNTGTLAVANAPYTITYSYADGFYFDSASDTSKTLTVNKATPVITWSNPADITYGTALSSTQLNATASVPGTLTYTPAPGSQLNAGNNQTLRVEFTPTDTNNYNSTFKEVYLNVLRKTLTVMAEDKTRAFGAANPTFTYTMTGFVGNDTQQSATTGQPALSTTADETSAGGDYIITAAIGDLASDNYTFAFVHGKLIVEKANQTITFAALSDGTFGDADFTVSATASSGLTVSFAASGQCSISGTTVHLTGAGTCTITALQAGNANFGAAPDVQQSFQIAQAATATALSSSANPLAVGQSVTFTATVTSPAGTPTGTIQFLADGSNLGSPVALNASGVATFTTSSLSVGTHNITAAYSGDANYVASAGALSHNQLVGSIFQFAQVLYTVAESAGSIAITVRRTGDTSQAVSVDYTTDDGSVPAVIAPCATTSGAALERCDYTRAGGTLRFAPSQTEQSFTVLVNADSFVEGTETTHLRLAHASGGAVIGVPSFATLEITDSAPPATGNPLDEAEFFVRQQYHDFLNREPDAEGLAFWVNQTANCGDADLLVCRINVSAAFFLSIEFQETGYHAYRTYQAAYGVATSPNVTGTVPVIRLAEFMADSQRLGRDVRIGIGDWQQQLEDNKAAYALEFVQSERFRAAFPHTLTAEQFVARLDENAGSVLSAAERAQLIALLGAAPAHEQNRAAALRAVAEHTTLRERELNRAFVLLQYYGYLRRNPDDAPDADFRGWRFWLTKLEEFNGNFVQAQMVQAFLESIEYRQRFAP